MRTLVSNSGDRSTRSRLGLVALLTATAASLSLVSAAKAGPAPWLEGVPRLNHVFVIVLENESESTSWGAASPATFLKRLRRQGASATNYYAASHLSADNYIALTSGQIPSGPFQTDCQNYGACENFEKAAPLSGRSLPDQLEGAHLSWGAYMDDMSRPCQHPPVTSVTNDPYQVGYATRHDPFVYYPPIVENRARCDAHVRPYTELRAALQSGRRVPNYVFITPDTCNDGHDSPCADGRAGGLKSADAWLAANVPLILGSAAYRDRGALFITFDEGATSDTGGCCATGVTGMGLDGGGKVGLLVLSPLARAGHATDAYYDHAAFLRTVEDGFGLIEHLNNASSPKAHPMADLFQAS